MVQAIEFNNPNVKNLGKFIVANSRRGLPVVERDILKGIKGAVVCGSAPTLVLPSTLAKIRSAVRRGFVIFACNEATRILHDAGVKFDYGVAMDPGVEVIDRLPVYSGPTYCLASSCNPALYEHIASNGGKVLIYHSACGWLGEMDLYYRLYANGDTVQGGFTVANRAIGLAHYMGIRRLMLCGMGFGYRKDAQYYAPGTKGKFLERAVMSDSGLVDGEEWFSHPDMIASAATVARLIKAQSIDVEGKMEKAPTSIIGDSLAASIAKRDDAFIDELVQKRKPDGELVPLG